MTMELGQTIERNDTKLVGYSVTVSLNQDLETSIIVKLREELFDKSHEIANRIDKNGAYLVQIYPDCEWTPDVPFESIVAVEVSDDAHIPEGFIRFTIPGGTYVKVTHNGPESRLGETYDLIREKNICDLRPFDFEYWADINSFEQEESTIDIYMPFF